jgi:hypothetical protein
MFDFLTLRGKKKRVRETTLREKVKLYEKKYLWYDTKLKAVKYVSAKQFNIWNKRRKLPFQVEESRLPPEIQRVIQGNQLVDLHRVQINTYATYPAPVGRLLISQRYEDTATPVAEGTRNEYKKLIDTKVVERIIDGVKTPVKINRYETIGYIDFGGTYGRREMDRKVTQESEIITGEKKLERNLIGSKVVMQTVGGVDTPVKIKTFETIETVDFGEYGIREVGRRREEEQEIARIVRTEDEISRTPKDVIEADYNVRYEIVVKKVTIWGMFSDGSKVKISEFEETGKIVLSRTPRRIYRTSYVVKLSATKKTDSTPTPVAEFRAYVWSENKETGLDNRVEKSVGNMLDYFGSTQKNGTTVSLREQMHRGYMQMSEETSFRMTQEVEGSEDNVEISREVMENRGEDFGNVYRYAKIRKWGGDENWIAPRFPDLRKE